LNFKVNFINQKATSSNLEIFLSTKTKFPNLQSHELRFYQAENFLVSAKEIGVTNLESLKEIYENMNKLQAMQFKRPVNQFID
jgi:hypothetical protein